MNLTADLYVQVRGRLAELGWREDYVWAQSVKQPGSPEDMAGEYVYVVLNSGMKNTVARQIFWRVMPCLEAGHPVSSQFGHKGKCAAIETVWEHRESHFLSFLEADAESVARVLDWCESLPWIGGITKYHLAKNLGCDVAKPDRWLVRLAEAEQTSVDDLCTRLARETGDRVATVDVVLWRACAVDVLAISDGKIEKGKSWET